MQATYPKLQTLYSQPLLRADRLHFGQSLALYKSVFEGHDEFTRYGTFDPKHSETLYSDRERAYFDEKVTEMVSPDELQAYLNANKLGVVEEAGDVLFEYTMLNALKKEIITEEVIDKVLKALVEPALNGSITRPEFTTMLDQVLEHIPENNQTKFLSMIGDFNPKKAKHLLALGVFKFATFRYYDPSYEYTSGTKEYLFSEVQELQEHLENRRVSGKRLPRFIRFADKHNLSIKVVSLYPKLLVDNYFKKNFTVRDMMKYAFIKQLGRQEFNYLHPEMSYNERKSHYKFKEAILEAGFLKRKGVKP